MTEKIIIYTRKGEQAQLFTAIYFQLQSIKPIVNNVSFDFEVWNYCYILPLKKLSQFLLEYRG